MAKQVINNGESGLIVRGKLNDNFTELYDYKAPLASPALTGTPTAPTAATGTNTTQLATTEFIQNENKKQRTVTSADASEANDSNSIIYFDSASPFNFTIEQLEAGVRFTLVNIGTATVTLVAGVGVTITGDTAILANKTANVLHNTATNVMVVTASSQVAWGDITGDPFDQTDLIETIFILT